MILTRRIKFFAENKEDNKKLFQYLHDGQRVLNDVYKNVALVNYVQNMDFLLDGTRKKIDEVCDNKSPNYSVAKKYKHLMPSSIYDACSTMANNDFKSDMSDIAKGVRSLRNYKKGTLPFRISGLRFVAKEKHYQFLLFGISISLVLGADKNDTASVLNRCINNIDGYKFSDSKFQYCERDKCFYLLLSIDFPKKDNTFDENMKAYATIGIDNFINIEYGAKKEYAIGDVSEFIEKRTQMRVARRRIQRNIYAKGGQGRNKKMKASDKIMDAESRFVDTYLHQVSANFINFLVRNKIGIVYLKTDESIFEKVDKDIKKLIVSNWSNYNLESKIMYKANMNGIEVIKEAVCAAV